ncbi:MarC family protein [Elusimicrobiota bacterium]
MNWNDLLKSTIILFAVVNPIGSVPIFLQLTDKMSSGDRKQTFKTALISSIVILFIFLLAGQQILTHLFHIKLYDLMAAGGLLLVIIAIDHLIFGALIRGVMTDEQQDPRHIGAVPIACPILAGPGAMMTVIITSSEYGFFTAAISIIVVFIITWLILHFIDVIFSVFGKMVCTVLSKILCLFLAAIGIHMLMQGLSYYFK